MNSWKYVIAVVCVCGLCQFACGQETIATEVKAAQPAAAPQQAAPAVNADVLLVLKNGDRISGDIDKFDGEKIVIKSTNLGELKIPWVDVKGVESSRLLYFRMEGGNIISGRAGGLEGERQIIVSPLAGRMAIPRESLIMVGPTQESVNPEHIRAEQELRETQEALRKATTVGSLWSGYIELSFSGNEGNKNDRTFIGIGHTERNTDVDHFTAHIDLQYAQARRVKTKNQVQGYLKEGLDITQRFYIWGQLSGEWDEINDINLRFRAEIGFGIHILKEGDWQVFQGDKITLDWELGGHFTNTDFKSATQRDTHSGGVVTRILYRHIFPNEWKLEITGEYYQSFQKPNDDRGNLDEYTLKGRISLTIPISSMLSFTGSIWDEYNNVTANPKMRRNDFYWTFGLRVSL